MGPASIPTLPGFAGPCERSSGHDYVSNNQSPSQLAVSPISFWSTNEFPAHNQVPTLNTTFLPVLPQDSLPFSPMSTLESVSNDSYMIEFAPSTANAPPLPGFYPLPESSSTPSYPPVPMPLTTPDISSILVSPIIEDGDYNQPLFGLLYRLTGIQIWSDRDGSCAARNGTN